VLVAEVLKRSIKMLRCTVNIINHFDVMMPVYKIINLKQCSIY